MAGQKIIKTTYRAVKFKAGAGTVKTANDRNLLSQQPGPLNMLCRS